MNNERRKSLEGAIAELRQAKEEIEKLDFSSIVDLFESAKTTIDEVKDEEQEDYDNMSEKAQEGEKGTQAEQVVSDLEDVMGEIDALITDVKDSNWGDLIEEFVAKIEGCT